MHRPHLTTAVVGAGPAGLLFCVVSRLLHERQGGDPADWPLRLYDKRDRYVRTHRLRMAPEPYLAIQRDVRDPRFDTFIEALRHAEFRPEVNVLEQLLVALLAELGVHKQIVAVGEAPGETDLAALRRALEAEGALEPEGRLTIVAADSVHSSVRELVRCAVAPVRHVHQRVARLRVLGPALPERLGSIEQYRLSKVLGSILDYRLNSNGFAEVDLFLSPGEHEAVRALGASPKDPVPLRTSQLSAARAPLFRRVVEHLEHGFGGGACEVVLQSTFELEHTVMPRLTFDLPELRAQVFLVGDAAVSLPFFRGMACLARCAHSLAHAHCDLVSLAKGRDTPALSREVDAEIERYFRAEGRPRRFGAWLLPGRILEVQPTVIRGVPAYVVLHRFVARYGAHVLSREGGGWRAHHHLAPVGRRAATDDFARRVDPAQRYELEADGVKRSEIAVVRARGRLIRVLRELVRVSALAPFPLQSWFLSAPEATRAPDRVSVGLWLNAALALAAAALALGGPTLAALGSPRAAWLAWAALPVQALGGVAYHAAHTVEPGPHRWVRAVWQAQTALLFAAGAPLAIFALRAASDPLRLAAASAWLVLAAMFVVGLYLYEGVAARWLARADLTE